MKKLEKLSINPEKVIKNDELVNLRGGYDPCPCDPGYSYFYCQCWYPDWGTLEIRKWYACYDSYSNEQINEAIATCPHGAGACDLICAAG
jgi:hypothetical protein